jgi:hypothetical protein
MHEFRRRSLMHILKCSEGYYSDRTFHRIGRGMERSCPSRKCYPGICRPKQREILKILMSARTETYTAAGAFERGDSWLDDCLGHRYVPFYV